MNLEGWLRVEKMLDTPQRLSRRIVPHFEFNLKHHHLKNNLNYLAFDFKKEWYWKFKYVYKHPWTFRPPIYKLTNSNFMSNN